MDDPQFPLAGRSDAENTEPPQPVHYTLTVPLLVALTTASGGHKPRDDERRDFPGALPWHPGKGISSHLATNDRFRRVLDALASLCVSRPRKQVFAIGVQIDKPNLVLTISDNQPVLPNTIKHVKAVWALLKLLSNLYAGQRTATSANHPSGIPWSHYVDVSPKMPRSKIAAGYTVTLAKAVYTFTSGKNMKRWAKRWDPEEGNGLLDFSRKFRAKKGSGLQGKDGQFEMMTTKLSIVLECLREKEPDWAEVLGYMTDATDLADELLADQYWCEILAMDITGNFPSHNLVSHANFAVAQSTPGIDAPPKPKPPPYPLRRHIEKLTSNHRYFRALIAFAHSPRLRLAFTLKMSVEIVSLPEITPGGLINVPTDPPSWARVLQDLCQQHQFRVDEERAQPILDYLGRHHHTATVAHRVHSECALVAHYDGLRTSSSNYTPAFSYIGVSKLSCKPCHLWLSAYNARLNVPKFYTRGSHGKWYFPWSPPIIAGWNPGLESTMETACVDYLGIRGALRSASDSTIASGETNWAEDDDELKEREERTRKAELRMLAGI